MLNDFLSTKILQHFTFSPTEEQIKLIETLSIFMTKKEDKGLFLLKGFAGTGKTSVVSALIKSMHELKMNFVLLAPTGRSAKVLSSYAEQKAWTIHKKIYRKQDASLSSPFSLAPNLHKDTLFIVDEASLISTYSYNNFFGSGDLLDDLIQYVYSAFNCHLLLIGDTAQLPPAMQEESVALDKGELETYGLQIEEFVLKQVLRQVEDSGILHYATELRNLIEKNDLSRDFRFHKNKFKDIVLVGGEDLIEEIDKAYQEVGVEETMIVTRSNKMSNLYAHGVRNRVFYKEDRLSNGDLLMLSKNNYYWAKEYEEFDFIANGDIVEIVRIHKYHDMYDLSFVDVTLRFLDYQKEIEARLLLDSLETKSPSEQEKLNEILYLQLMEDYADIKNKKKKHELLKEDQYFNALQVKFAYAITCHKAQGGEWKYVFIDIGFKQKETYDMTDYKWLYTAITRASEKVFLINFPENFIEKT